MRASLPRIITISAKVGDDIELDCSSGGQPHPEIFWYKYNVPLLDITYRRLEDTIMYGKLVLSNILLADAGNYSCHVNNTLGSISRTFLLYVYGELLDKCGVVFVIKATVLWHTIQFSTEQCSAVHYNSLPQKSPPPPNSNCKNSRLMANQWAYI